MAIDNTRLVVTTVKHDGIGETPPTPACVRLAPEIPPAAYYDGQEAVIQAPEYEGQVVVHRSGDLFTMYVVVAFPTATAGDQLEWKRCGSLTGVINPNTGQPWDPLAPFYSNLAN